MNFLKIAGRDIASIFKNRFIRVSVIAIIIVPLLYSLLYLAAFWDPYSKLDKLPVAVVNMDKGTITDGKSQNYGDDIVDKLKDDDQLGWRFVSKEDAETGVKGKKYYAMFVIPEDFSQKIVSAKTGKPQKPSILYTSNDKRNFIASQINGKVLVLLKAEITKSISKEYTKVTFDNLYDVKDGFNKAADGSKKIADGIDTAKDGTYKLKDGLGQLNKKVPELSTGVGKLFNGSQQLSTGLGQLNSKVPELSTGIGKLTNGSKSLSVALNTANSGATQLNTGAKQLVDSGLNPVASGINTLDDKFVNQMLPGMKTIKDGTLQLSQGLSGAKDGADKLSKGATTLSGSSSELSKGASDLKIGYDQLSPSLDQLKDGTAGVESGVNDLINSSTQAQQAIAQSLQAYLAANPDAKKDLNMQKLLGTLQAMGSQENATKVSVLKDGAHKVSQGAASLAVGAKTFVDGTKKFADGSVAYSQGAAQFSQGATTLASGVSQAVSGSKALSDGASQLYDASNSQFKLGLGMLSSSMPTLLKGGSDLTKGTSQLSGGLSQISSGANTLNAGMSQLGGNVPQLTTGITALYNGSKTLSSGLGTLNQKVPELKSGVKQLSDGSNSLYTGLDKLSKGSNELNDKLQDGAKDINKNLVNSSEDMGNFVSQPINMNEKPVYSVKNYGTGFTPYFIPLSLWVGALMMFFVITDKVDNDINAGSASVVAGKYLSYGFIGLLQAVLVSMVVLMLGLKPSNIPLYFLFNIFMSYVFIAIIQCLVFLLDQAGRLLAIALLILQLTACAGTFPLEVVPKFFKVLNPIMPFTYCVSALREIISGIDYSVFGKDVVVLGSVLVVFLFISMLLKGHADKVKEIINEKKEEASA